jgi:hypothetical protein
VWDKILLKKRYKKSTTGEKLTKFNLKFFSRVPHEMIDEWFEEFIPPIGAFVEINGHRYKITDVVIEQTRDKETARTVRIELL